VPQITTDLAVQYTALPEMTHSVTIRATRTAPPNVYQAGQSYFAQCPFVQPGATRFMVRVHCRSHARKLVLPAVPANPSRNECIINQLSTENMFMHAKTSFYLRSNYAVN
jgi:hypothetical protein